MMKYLVINLEPIPRIATKDGDPIIFETKQDAFRVADKCRKGLVYPIVDIMKTLEAIKVKYKNHTWNNDSTAVEEILTMLDEII